MKQEIVKQIQENPKYQELVSKRSKFAWTLSIAMLVIYYAFILVIAFDPSLLGIKMGDGVMTIGIPIGVFIIVFAFVLTGIYVRRANGEFDELSREIKESVKG
ncbi:MAG: DUF485 domain-containing protein [Sulfurovaceae bacterium]|jgi:uncharacterized membrane protein (DUF485 family)